MRSFSTVMILVITFCAFTATPGLTQKLSYGLNGGISIPQGDGSDYWKLGYSINGGASYRITPYFSLNMRAAYNRWKQDEGGFGNFTILEFIPAIQIYPLRNDNQTLRPFIHGGLGVYYLDFKLKTSGYWIYEESDNDTRPGTSMGIGTQYSLSNSISLEFLSLYHIIFTKDDTTQYFSLSAGLWF